MMIGYVTIGTNDLNRAIAFYDALLAEVGAKRWMQDETFAVWGPTPGVTSLMVTLPFNGESATGGNGVMVALLAKNPEQVDALYKKAIELGASDEGAPGPRGDAFYAGYFRDLDGNKLNFFHMKRS